MLVILTIVYKTSIIKSVLSKNGKGDAKMDIKELKKLAKAKDTDAIIKLAKFYGGLETRKGMRFYFKAARLNNAEAQEMVASHYYVLGTVGHSPNDLKKCIKWCEKAKTNGSKDQSWLDQMIEYSTDLLRLRGLIED